MGSACGASYTYLSYRTASLLTTRALESVHGLDARSDSALRVSCELERHCGRSTSTPSLLRRRQDRCLRLTPS